MNNKWQLFVFGILAGLFMAGIIILISTSKNSLKFNNGSSLYLIENSTFSTQKILPSFVASTASPDKFNYHPLELTSKIELNSATLEELSTLPGIGDAKGQSIIAFREKYGNFAAVSELLYVPGIGESIFSQIKDLVYIGTSKE